MTRTRVVANNRFSKWACLVLCCFVAVFAVAPSTLSLGFIEHAKFRLVRLLENVSVRNLSFDVELRPTVPNRGHVGGRQPLNDSSILASWVHYAALDGGIFMRSAAHEIKSLLDKYGPEPSVNHVSGRLAEVLDPYDWLHRIIFNSAIDLKHSYISPQLYSGGAFSAFYQFASRTPQVPRIDHQSTSELNKKGDNDSKNSGKNDEQRCIIVMNPVPEGSHSVSESEKNRSAKKGTLVLFGIPVLLTLVYLIIKSPLKKRNENESDKDNDQWAAHD